MEINKKLPDKVKRRLALFNMFYPLEQNAKRKWAKLFGSSFDNIIDVFHKESLKLNYEQIVISDQMFLWKDKVDAKVECIFSFIKDITVLKNVSSIFKYIDKHKPNLSYAIVRQKKDGENVYDIFRFSKFSYLEHCNRVKF